jgi:hypothetical protein
MAITNAQPMMSSSLSVSGRACCREAESLLFALELGSVGGVLGGADSHTVLVIRNLASARGSSTQPSVQRERKAVTHERHPLHVKDVLSSGDVRRHIAADRVTKVLGTPGVELSSGVTRGLDRQQMSGGWKETDLQCWPPSHPRNRRSRHRAAS